MADILSFIKFALGCFTVIFIAFFVLLALPQSRLRSVCLEVTKWGVAGLMALLVISPIDIIPDVIPVVGWLDDLGYIVGGICAARSALKEHEIRKALPQ